MFLKKLRILNYKSFCDSGFLEFGEGFNVIVGQNNSGKTALLESIRLNSAENKPHKSRNIPAGQPLNPQSLFEFDLAVDGLELVDALIRVNGHEQRKDVETHLLHSPAARSAENKTLVVEMYAIPGAYAPRETGASYEGVRIAANGDLPEAADAGGRSDIFCRFEDPSRRDLVLVLFNGFSPRFYAFKAERLNVGISGMIDTPVLEPNASNLPCVLANLFNKNPNKTREYNRNVSAIFPSVTLVQSRNVNGMYRIVVSSEGPESDRDDLANYLEDCGSGIGQVLAILYVAMTLPPSVIAIDEPNSFLHPGAVKKLMQILGKYKHQYIISTHSTDVISSVNADTLHLVQWADGESKVIRLDRNQMNDLRLVLSDVGVGLSDVFAADRVIWVEGQTEQICFPKLVASRLGRLPTGVSFLAVFSTGDFEAKGRSARKIWQLYKTLGNANGIMPVAVAYSLDSELHTAATKTDFQRECPTLCFLPRRCYENYLLVPEAIAAVLSNHASGENPIDPAGVASWLASNGANFHPEKIAPTESIWIDRVDAARLLACLFSNLSQTTVSYDKTRHSVELTDWLLKNQPDALSELVDYVVNLIPSRDVQNS